MVENANKITAPVSTYGNHGIAEAKASLVNCTPLAAPGSK